MFCPVCGAKSDKPIEFDGALICPECGCVMEYSPAKTDELSPKQATSMGATATALSIFSLVLYTAMSILSSIKYSYYGITTFIINAAFVLLGVMNVLRMYNKKKIFSWAMAAGAAVFVLLYFYGIIFYRAIVQLIYALPYIMIIFQLLLNENKLKKFFAKIALALATVCTIVAAVFTNWGNYPMWEALLSI